MTSSSSFFRDFAIVIALSSVSKFLIARHLLETDVPNTSWIGFLFISVLTVIVHNFLLKASTKRPQLFVASFMGALTAKLLLSALFLVAVGVLVKDELKFTAISFFILYALLTIVDIKSLLPILRSDNR
jgi:hypothetical protein